MMTTTKLLTNLALESSQNGWSSDIQVESSLMGHTHHTWLKAVLGLTALAGIIAAVGIPLMAFVIHPSTTIGPTMSTTTLTTSTSTVKICFVTPSPRPSNIWFFVDNMTNARYYHTSTLISQDKSILLAGGLNTVTLASIEKYIPSTGCFQTINNMPRVRYGHTADQLSFLSDYILFAGGYGIAGALNIADLFDPMTGYTSTITLTSPRFRQTSTLINQSRLVLIGGGVYTGDVLKIGSHSSFAMISNNDSVIRYDHTVTRLGNNSDIILITGGWDGWAVFYSSVCFYYGSLNIFTTLTGLSMPTIRAFHTATYLPPPIHKVLITGGHYDGWNILNTMLLFDIATLSFTTLTSTMSSRRSWHTATLLPNGKVLLAGGSNNSIATDSCELIDPTNNYCSTSAGSLHVGRYRHTATSISNNDNGTVLVCGGLNGITIFNTCELYLV